jgi:hypothetical protein
VFDRVYERWQRFLDATRPVPLETTLEIDEPTPRSWEGRYDPVTRELSAVDTAPRPTRHGATLRTIREADDEIDMALTTAETPPPWVTRDQHAYEATLPPWARQALTEMDQAVQRALIDMQRFTARVEGRYVVRHDWETPQYGRRHARNMASVTGDVADLLDGDGVEAVAKRMMSRARRASSEDVTGVIPVVRVNAVEEESWA